MSELEKQIADDMLNAIKDAACEILDEEDGQACFGAIQSYKLFLDCIYLRQAIDKSFA